MGKPNRMYKTNVIKSLMTFPTALRKLINLSPCLIMLWCHKMLSWLCTTRAHQGYVTYLFTQRINIKTALTMGYTINECNSISHINWFIFSLFKTNIIPFVRKKNDLHIRNTHKINSLFEPQSSTKWKCPDSAVCGLKCCLFLLDSPKLYFVTLYLICVVLCWFNSIW